MTTSAAQSTTATLELDERVRRAWGVYREHLSGLGGAAYDLAERTEWEDLQTELHRIAAERDAEAGPPGAAATS